MNNTILSYIFIALSIIFLFWSIFKTEETRKNNHKDIKIIILHFIDLALIIINMVVIGNVLLSKQSTTSSVMPIYMIHMAGSSIKNFGLMIAIAIPLIIICYPLWKKISKKLKSSGLSIINIFEMILLSYVIYKILTKFITFCFFIVLFYSSHANALILQYHYINVWDKCQCFWDKCNILSMFRN